MGWFADRKARKREKKEREERLKFLSAPVYKTPKPPVDDGIIHVYDEYGNREDPVMEAVVGTAFTTGQMVTWTADTGLVVHEDPAPAPTVDCPPDTTATSYPSDHVTICEPSPPPYETSSYDYGSSGGSGGYDSGSSYSGGGDSGGGGGGGE
jgi:uncharacterized membrane protein YgcG